MQGKVATVSLAGEFSCQSGYDIPVGMLDIDLPSRKTLFQLHAERLRRVQAMASRICGKRWDFSIPLINMIMADYTLKKDFMIPPNLVPRLLNPWRGHRLVVWCIFILMFANSIAGQHKLEPFDIYGIRERRKSWPVVEPHFQLVEHWPPFLAKMSNIWNFLFRLIYAECWL